MGSVFMPVDPCKVENGCLAVLEGSHKMGRIDHVQVGGQVYMGLQNSDIYIYIYIYSLTDVFARNYSNVALSLLKVGAEPTRLEAAQKLFKMVHIEMQPGDVLFFHANLLHTRCVHA